jgi:hypothetical protein
MEELYCASCHFAVSETFFFCPNCGKKRKEPPLATSIGKQIGIYLLSFFLPPLGLWPGVKYMMQKDSKAQIVGIVAIVLTIVSIVLTVWTTMGIVNEVNKSLLPYLSAGSSGIISR